MHLVYTIQFQALNPVHPIKYPIIPPMWSTWTLRGWFLPFPWQKPPVPWPRTSSEQLAPERQQHCLNEKTYPKPKIIHQIMGKMINPRILEVPYFQTNSVTISRNIRHYLFELDYGMRLEPHFTEKTAGTSRCCPQISWRFWFPLFSQWNWEGNDKSGIPNNKLGLLNGN